MKKLLGIMVLGLLLSGNAYAEKLITLENCRSLSGKRIIPQFLVDLDKGTFEVKTNDEMFRSFNAQINFNASNKEITLSKQKGWIYSKRYSSDNMFVSKYTIDESKKIEAYYQIELEEKKVVLVLDLPKAKKKLTRKERKNYELHSGSGLKKKIWKDTWTFPFNCNKYYASGLDDGSKKAEAKNKVKLASMIDKAKDTCKSLGFEEGTEKFADCSLKLYSQSVELAAEQNKTVVMQPQSSGSNVMTIYDPVRDNNALIKRGQRMLSGACTLGIDC